MNDDHGNRPIHTGIHSSDTTNTETTAQQQIPATAPAGRTKRRPGAPEGLANGNALHLLKSKATARVTRDKHRRSAERLVRDALDSAGLSDHPLARMIGRNLVRLESAASRCEERADKRGYFNARGIPSPAFSKLTEVVGQQLAEFRRMLESLAPVATERAVRVTIVDDPFAPDGGSEITPEDWARWNARGAAPGTALGPRYDDLTLAGKLAVGEIVLPDEAAIAARLQDEDQDPDDVSALRPPDGQRRPGKARQRVSTTPSPPTTAPGGAGPEAPQQTVLEVFEDADRRAREFFDHGGSFGGIGALYR